MKMFKISFAILAMLVLPITTLAEEPVVNPYGKFYVGNGVEVEMAMFAKKNDAGLYDVLLKISGANAFNAGIDGKTFKYEAIRAGTGIDYQYAGKTRMIVRQPWGESWSVIEVFLDGKTIALGEDAYRSKEVRPLHLLTAWKSDNKK